MSDVIYMPRKKGLDKEEFVLRSKALELAIDYEAASYFGDESDPKRLFGIASMFRAWLNDEVLHEEAKDTTTEPSGETQPEPSEDASGQDEVQTEE